MRHVLLFPDSLAAQTSDDVLRVDAQELCDWRRRGRHDRGRHGWHRDQDRIVRESVALGAEVIN